MSTRPLALFGPRFQRLARWRCQPRLHVLLSGQDQGLPRLRQQRFRQAYGLPDRWPLSQAVWAFTGPDQAEFRRLMPPLGDAESQAALRALSRSPVRPLWPQVWETLCLSGHQESMEAWRRLPAGLRSGPGAQAAAGQKRLRPGGEEH